MIDPYTVQTPTKTHQLTATTMIDPVTSWFEVAPLSEPSSFETQKAFDSYWLARYPRPQECGIDNGLHFKKYFPDLIDNYGLKQKVSSDYNPQSNGVMERIHQVIGNTLSSTQRSRNQLNKPMGQVPISCRLRNQKYAPHYSTGH